MEILLQNTHSIGKVSQKKSKHDDEDCDRNVVKQQYKHAKPIILAEIWILQSAIAKKCLWVKERKISNEKKIKLFSEQISLPMFSFSLHEME